MASHGGKSAARVWRNVSAERAAAALLEEHGQSALEQARLELAAAKRARRQKLFGYRKQVEAFPLVGSTAMVDPPRQFLLLSCVDERRVGHAGVLSGAQAPLIVVDQGGVVARGYRRVGVTASKTAATKNR